MVVELAVLRQGFAKHYYYYEGVGEGEGCTMGRVWQPSPPLFIGEGERGPAPLDPI